MCGFKVFVKTLTILLTVTDLGVMSRMSYFSKVPLTYSDMHLQENRAAAVLPPAEAVLVHSQNSILNSELALFFHKVKSSLITNILSKTPSDHVIHKLIGAFYPIDANFVLITTPKPKEVSPHFPKVPGLPNDFPVARINISNIVRLIEAAQNGHSIDDSMEELILQIASEIGTFIGIQDLREWIGLIVMYFLTGPVLVPLYWLPISLLALGFLMIPLVFNGASLVAAKSTKGEFFKLKQKRYRNLFETSSSHQSGLDDSFCMEMLSCEFHNWLRSSHWFKWISEEFNLTKIQWVDKSEKDEEFNEQEDCLKYHCALIHPLQRFFSNWYTYFFHYRRALDKKRKRRKRIRSPVV